jgi:hypothetical protein
MFHASNETQSSNVFNASNVWYNKELVHLSKYLGDQVKEEGMGGACRIHGRNEKCIQKI